LAELPAYFERGARPRGTNAHFFRQPAHALAEMIAGELPRRGAIAERDGAIAPALF